MIGVAIKITQYILTIVNKWYIISCVRGDMNEAYVSS